MVVDCDKLLVVNIPFHIFNSFEGTNFTGHWPCVCGQYIHYPMWALFIHGVTFYRWKSFSMLCSNIVEYICSGIHGGIEMLAISLLHVLLFWVWSPPKVVDRVHTFYPPREMKLVASFHWLNLFLLFKLNSVGKWICTCALHRPYSYSQTAECTWERLRSFLYTAKGSSSSLQPCLLTTLPLHNNTSQVNQRWIRRFSNTKVAFVSD